MRLPKLKIGSNMMKGNNKYVTIGAAAFLGIGAAWILQRMVKGNGTKAIEKSMISKAAKAYARPALVSGELGLGASPGGNWLAVPHIENKRDNYMLNRLPTLASNVVGFPINENNMRFIGGTGFGLNCDQGRFALTT